MTSPRNTLLILAVGMTMAVGCGDTGSPPEGTGDSKGRADRTSAPAVDSTSPVTGERPPPRPAPQARPAGGAMFAPPFAVPVGARHLAGRAPEIEVDRQKELGTDTFVRKHSGRTAALIVDGKDQYDLTQVQIDALNQGRSIHVAVDEELAGRTVEVETYVPMVDKARKFTMAATCRARIAVPVAGKAKGKGLTPPRLGLLPEAETITSTTEVEGDGGGH